MKFATAPGSTIKPSSDNNAVRLLTTLQDSLPMFLDLTIFLLRSHFFLYFTKGCMSNFSHTFILLSDNLVVCVCSSSQLEFQRPMVTEYGALG